MQPYFGVIILGALGGPFEDNLPGYLLYPLHKVEEVIAIDAGSLLGGIEKAINAGNLTDFPGLSSFELLKKIKAYLISHAHLDHVAALVLNSPADSAKPLFAIPSVIDFLQEHLFNWKIWPNYGSEGENPILHVYDYKRLIEKEKKAIEGTEYRVEAYLLNHPGNYTSTAFFIEHGGEYILYLGDTSSDLIEEEKRLQPIWEKAASLFCQGKLHALFLECSFTHVHAEEVAYGHLNTPLFFHEMQELAKLAKRPLEGLKVVVTHRKQDVGDDYPKKIQEELLQLNTWGVDLLFPQQGQKFLL